MFRSVAFTLCLLSPNCIEACARLLYLSSHISVPKNPLKIDNASSEKATFRQIASRLAKGCFGLRTVRHDFNASGGLKLFFLLFRILWSSFGTVTSDVYGKGVQPSRTTIHVTLQHLSEICSHRHHSWKTILRQDQNTISGTVYLWSFPEARTSYFDNHLRASAPYRDNRIR